MIIKKEDCKLVSLTRRICQRFTDFYIIENKGKIVSAAVFFIAYFCSSEFRYESKMVRHYSGSCKFINELHLELEMSRDLMQLIKLKQRVTILKF